MNFNIELMKGQGRRWSGGVWRGELASYRRLVLRNWCPADTETMSDETRRETVRRQATGHQLIEIARQFCGLLAVASSCCLQLGSCHTMLTGHAQRSATMLHGIGANSCRPLFVHCRRFALSLVVFRRSSCCVLLLGKMRCVCAS